LSLHTELPILFNKTIIRRSRSLEPEKVDALAVKEAAGAFLRLKGRPSDQLAMVKQLPPNTAAALCRWLADPAFWGLVGEITRH
jgi:hypothetical protein